MSSLCRTSALRFLKIRPRSIEELRLKLSNKGFDASEINETLQYLQGIDLLNDRTFTASWIQYRLGRPFGFRRIIAELKQKGVPEAIIHDAVSLVSGGNEGYDEDGVALELGLRRAKRLLGHEVEKKRRRISDFLLRRGFSMDSVMKVIRKISA